MISVGKGGFVNLHLPWTETQFGAMIMGTPITLTDDEIAVLKAAKNVGKPIFVQMDSTGDHPILAPAVISGGTRNVGNTDWSALKIVLYTWIEGVGTSICLRADFSAKTLSYDATP